MAYLFFVFYLFYFKLYLFSFLRKCIECLFPDPDNLGKDCKDVCQETISHSVVETFTLQGKECNQKDSQGCWIKFKLEQLTGIDSYLAEILNTKGTYVTDCKSFIPVCFLNLT